jgi:CheY-like chemotaxis protein
MTDFLIIDDDSINNLICTRIIQITYPEANVQSYINPISALAHMREKYSMPGANHVVLFLDINMPELSAWEVLDEFDTFPEHVKNLFKIFILSSSIFLTNKKPERTFTSLLM